VGWREATGESGNGRPGREEDETDSSSPLGREMRGEAASSDGANQKGKHIPVKTRPTRGLGGSAGVVSTYGGSGASGLVGPKAEWAERSAGPKVGKRISELKIGFLNLPRIWKFVEGDFGGILA
jgi:hypothetical protein